MDLRSSLNNNPSFSQEVEEPLQNMETEFFKQRRVKDHISYTTLKEKWEKWEIYAPIELKHGTEEEEKAERVEEDVCHDVCYLQQWLFSTIKFIIDHETEFFIYY